MPRYYFHLHDDVENPDEEGSDLPDLSAAKVKAIRSARGLMAEAVANGVLTLSHWIEVRDESGNEVLAVQFGDAVTIKR